MRLKLPILDNETMTVYRMSTVQKITFYNNFWHISELNYYNNNYNNNNTL